MRRTTMEAAYFDELYAGDPDPWRFDSSDYERAKYAATLDALPKCAYQSALEVGCSIGVFTCLLAARCQRLLAIDPAEKALESARRRCAEHAHVRFERMAAPDQWPTATFDLIVLSEVVYYLRRYDVGRLAERVKSCLRPGGAVILVHWLGQTDYPLSGDEAASAFIADASAFAAVIRQRRTPDYRLDVLSAA